MSPCVLVVLAALTAVVCASEKAASTASGTVTCEWTNFKYNESIVNSIRYSFMRISTSEQVVEGKEASLQKLNSTNGNIAFVLTLKSLRPQDVQAYRCALWIDESVKFENVIPISARPVPYVDSASVTIFEGESITMNCSFVSSSPYRLGNYTFRKYRDDTPGELPESVKRQQTQGSITIAVAKKEHRGLYTCTATNEVGSTTLEFYLRVKSPLAALWPAIGIFLEVVILIIIVFVYERRREAAKQQDTGDIDDAHNNSREKSKNSSDVRQRGVKG